MAVIKCLSAKSKVGHVLDYIQDMKKTEKKIVSGIRCNPETAREEMNFTKELYGKTEGRQYYHVIQSFKPGEITPEKAHEIGQELAEEKFKEYECVVVTHIDKEHVHNHIVVNSVNKETGKMYYSSKQNLRELKNENDRICKREGLSVPEQKKNRYFSMGEVKITEKGKSFKFRLMDDIDRAKDKSLSRDEFIGKMKEQGYEVNWTDTRKYITYTMPEGQKFRDRSLPSEYSKENMEHGFRQAQEEQAREESHDREKGKSREEIERDFKEFFGDIRSHKEELTHEKESKDFSTDEIKTYGKDEILKIRLMDDIDRVREKSLSKDEFIGKMKKQGYEVTWTDTRKYITYTTPEGKKFRDKSLPSEYSKEVMEDGFRQAQEEQRTKDGNERGAGKSREDIDREFKQVFGDKGGNDRDKSQSNDRNGKLYDGQERDAGVERERREGQESIGGNNEELRRDFKDGEGQQYGLDKQSDRLYEGRTGETKERVNGDRGGFQEVTEGHEGRAREDQGAGEARLEKGSEVHSEDRNREHISDSDLDYWINLVGKPLDDSKVQGEVKQEKEKEEKEVPKERVFDVAAIAKKLEFYRAEFIRGTIQVEIKPYSENLEYEQRLYQIKDCAERINEQVKSIESLQEERSRLDFFAVKKNKALQTQISKMEEVKQNQYSRLERLGVEEMSISGIQDTIDKYKKLVEQEVTRAKASREEFGRARQRAEESKRGYRELAKEIPEDRISEVKEEQERIRESFPFEERTLDYHMAEIKAKRGLDSSVITREEKERIQQRSNDRDGQGRDRDRGHSR